MNMFICFYDRDKKTFNVVGPVNSDINTTNFVYSLQKEGRNINMSVIREPEHNIEYYRNQLPKGYTLDTSLDFLKD